MSSGKCWTGSSESRSLIHLSSSSVYVGSVGAAAAGGTDAAGAGTFVGGVADMATGYVVVDVSVAETLSDATKCYEWVRMEGSPFGQH